MMALTADSENFKERLIRSVKKEVKQIMEEAVTRKFVHEESSSVTSLCGAVEACLSQGLRRRALGLFKTSSTTALVHKLGKTFDLAAVVSKKVQEIDNLDPNRRSSSSGDSTSRLSNKPPLQKKNSSGSVPGPRYLWIRLALFDKSLARIIDHLVQNSCKYYEKDALVADSDYGSILSSLLVGPCALDYSKTKTQDHFWTDPPADELVQRHRISSGHATPPTCRRPGLNYRRSLHAGSSEEIHRQLPISAKDYVESLHQNNRATLLYGKNNVLVLPKDLTTPMPGYLSLHQTAQSLTIKWTPNQLMNGYSETEIQDKSLYWDYAMNVRVDEIVYVHCHQQADSGGTVVLVGQDGVQRPPIHFPRGGHLLAFLSCLETGLLPRGQLDPPLWSQRGKGKVFPRLRRKGRPMPTILDEDSEEESTDYVFRIVDKARHEDFLAGQELMDGGPLEPGGLQQLQSRVRAHLISSSTASSTSSSKSLSQDVCSSASDLPDSPRQPLHKTHPTLATGESVQLVCATMKRQIISRAFYGWLAYCRHLSTVRTHLSALVNPLITPPGQADGLTRRRWDQLIAGGSLSDQAEMFRLTYFGGVDHDVRKEAWPYLLGHYGAASTAEDRAAQDVKTRQGYETTMSEWLAVEAIVRQRDKETMAANLAKLSSESTSGGDQPPPPATLARELSNDVFEDNVSMESDDNDPVVDPGEGEEGEEGEEAQQNLKNHRQDLTNSTTGPHSPDITQENHRLCASPDEGLFEDEGDEGEVVIVTTNPSLDSGTATDHNSGPDNADLVSADKECGTLTVREEGAETTGGSRSNCISPASSQGGVYSLELLETFGLNVHRIDKDVQRCDRNYWYFTSDNLEKLRNIMCTYVWEHLEVGYMQGMCDLVAPLLVVFDDEGTTYACFCHLMERMGANFPNGGAMDNHFANLRSLIQILDSEMFELMHQNGDYTHFYFCYRWFLLDFKRELLYDDVFSTWETIWAAKHVASGNFVLFIALALVETYREIILNNSMDFTDIIKFFNEMAERHDAKVILKLARELVLQLQTLIENK